MAARHFKYIYSPEIPPKTVLANMLKSNNLYDNNILDLNNERNRLYFNRRRELKYLMKAINSHIDNNSQSLFLTLYYMDIIFTNKDLEEVFFSHFYVWKAFGSSNDIQMNNYVLLSLACLILASKFNENDPHVPTMSSYIRLLFEYSKKKYIFNLESLYMAEVVVAKILKYKLNYYTIYHYLIFFFTHGIILKETIEKSKIHKLTERKILEKIYIQAREILDGMIDNEKYFNLYFGKDNYIIVIEIFLWSIEHVMNIKLKDNENLFKLVFNINIEENKHKKLYETIYEIYKNLKKKNSNGDYKSTRIPFNNSSVKASNCSKESEISSMPSSINPQNLDINFKYIEPKNSVPNSTSYKLNKPFYENVPKAIIKTEKDKDFDYYNRLIENEIEKMKYNYAYKIPYPLHNSNNSNQSMPRSDNMEYAHSNIKYGPNNRIYLTSNKSNYHLNSAEKNMQKKFNPINDIDKEPTYTDNNINYNYNNINMLNNNNNDNDKLRKRAFSCSKKVYNYNLQNNYRPSANISTNIINKIKFEDNFNKVKISDKQLNNYFYNFTPINNNQYKNNNINIIKKENENIYQNYHQTKNNNNIFKSYNDINLIGKDQFNFNEKNVITKISPNLELEPKDNNRRRLTNNKYYINSGMKVDMNKNYNKPNTIIINNNIHINNFIDKNINQKDMVGDNVSKNLFLYSRQNEKKTNELLNAQKMKNKFKNIRNKKKYESNTNNSRNKSNKSSISLTNKLNDIKTENIFQNI